MTAAYLAPMIRGEMMQLLTPREVDVMLRYPAGRTLRLVKAGKIPSIRLPDGEVRIDEAALKKLLDAGTYRGARRG